MKSKIIVLSIIELLIVVLMLVTGEISIGIIAIVLAVLFFGGFIINRIVSKNISVEIKIAEDNYQGGDIAIEIIVKNKSVFPAFKNHLKLVAENKNFSFRDNGEFFFSVAPRQKRTLRYLVKSDYCGVYDLVIKEIKCIDLWGITYRKICKKEAFQAIMYPRYEMVRKVSQVLKANYEKEKKFAGRKNNILTDILQYRAYQKGDNLKNINWKLSNKMDELIVKEFDTPIDNQILLVIDQIKGQANYQNLTYSVFFSIAMTYIKNNISFQATWVNNNIPVVKNIYGAKSLLSCMKEILKTRIEDNQTAEVLSKQSNLKKYAKIIYVTNGMNRNTALTLLSWGNATSIVVDERNFNINQAKTSIKQMAV